MKRQGKTAGNLVLLENDEPISRETEEIQARIRQRAYELSMQRGHAGREVDDWLTAESEIISIPPLEMTEKNGAYQLQLAIAGVGPENLSVMAARDQMLIKCDFQHDHATESETVHVCDFRSATVFRSIRFPQPIDLKTIKTEFQNGMLRVIVNKEGAKEAAGEQPRKRQTARKSPVKGSTKRGAA